VVSWNIYVFLKMKDTDKICSQTDKSLTICFALQIIMKYYLCIILNSVC
jgi:hypothetical protein